MSAFTGTWRLLRLILRRDRVRLLMWLVGILGLIGASVPALQETYGTPQARTTYFNTMTTSVVARAYGGNIDSSNMGSIVVIELYIFTAILIAFMSTTLVVRHTRQNEEAGSAELIGSARVGRFASLSAALIAATIVNILIAVVTGLIISQLPDIATTESWMFGLIFAAVGISFAAIAGICAQVTTSARSANGLAGAAIAGAFLVRAIGDAFGGLSNGLADNLWISWLSPLGWGQLIKPFSDQNWWIFGLFIGLVVIGTGLAYAILSRRDVGAGLIPESRGPAKASRLLTSPLGLAWRLQRTSLAWWLFASATLAATVGAMTKEVQSLVNSSEAVQQYIAAMGGAGGLVDAFLGAMIGYNALVTLGFVTQSLLKARQEESSGRLESLLGTSVGRVGWLMSHLLITVCGMILVCAVSGLALTAAYVLAVQAEWSQLPRLIEASLVYIPALLVMAGVIIAGIGLLPRYISSIAWLLFAGLFFLGQLGALLKLPDWVMKISPFQHVPSLPAEDLTWRPLIALTAIGITLIVVGLAAFRRRNLITS